ncbi:Bromelain inhibitor, partial [Ananas comosus]
MDKRSGIALLVLLVAVSCLASPSSARAFTSLDFLARVINGERVTLTACSECVCPLQTSSSDDEYKCYCADTYSDCPGFCKKCKAEFGKYICLDLISPNDCVKPVSSSEAKQKMIKGERVTLTACSECVCPLRTSSSDEEYKCYCTDTYSDCPGFCKKCKAEFGKYICLDLISPNDCVKPVSSLEAKQNMIKEERVTLTACSECVCPLRTSSSDEEYKCYCTDTYSDCPGFCKTCKAEFGKYICLDLISPNDCVKPVSSWEARQKIKLLQG